MGNRETKPRDATVFSDHVMSTADLSYVPMLFSARADARIVHELIGSSVLAE